MTFLPQMEQEILELLVAEAIRGLVVMFSQPIDPVHVSFLSTIGHPSNNEFPDEVLSKCSHIRLPSPSAQIATSRYYLPNFFPSPRSGLVQHLYEPTNCGTNMLSGPKKNLLAMVFHGSISEQFSAIHTAYATDS